MEVPQSIVETIPEMHIFVSPPDLLDTTNQKHIIIPLEPIDLSNNQDCTCKGPGYDECSFEGIALQGGIPEKDLAHLKLPFAFYILIKNNWIDIDDETRFYAFKSQIVPTIDLGEKMVCLTDAIYMGSSAQFEKSTKSKMAVILHFNNGILKLVQIVITKLDQIVVTKIPASLIDGRE